MKTLYLLRHGKSDWSNPGLPDRDRPLAPRGRKAARAVGHHLAHIRPRPQLVLCSPALRAEATWDAVGAALDPPVEVRLEEALYGADSAQLLTRLRRVPDTVEAAVLVGHNPSLQELALGLAGDGDIGALNRLREKFPTGALATLSFDTTWRSLGTASAYLESVVVPRDLPSRARA